MKKSRISDVKKGSVELTVAGIGVVSAVVMPIVAIHVSKYFKRRNETINFNIKVGDIRLQQLLDEYEEGYFGNGQDGLDSIIRILSHANYNIEAISNNTYNIEHMINKYTKRIVKTIKKHR